MIFIRNRIIRLIIRSLYVKKRTNHYTLIVHIRLLYVHLPFREFSLKSQGYVVSIRIVVAFGGHGVGCSDGVSAARGMECAVE